MASDVTTFGVSLGVSVFTVVVTRYQTRVLLAALEKHYRDQDIEELSEIEPALEQERPVYENPEVAEAFIGQNLDIATNYPAAILTLIAFSQLSEIAKSQEWIFLALAVALTLGSLAATKPTLAGR